MLLELSSYLEKYVSPSLEDRCSLVFGIVLVVAACDRVCLMNLVAPRPDACNSFLWPNFDAAKASKAFLMSMIIMVNEKFRTNVRAWGRSRSTSPAR
jgi:hypothetical protein